MVIPDLVSRDREGVLREMVLYLKKKNYVSKEKQLYEKLLQRENLGSTAIADGIAIPHCKFKGVKNALVLLAISRQGVNFNSLDGKPSHLFFLVISSPDNPSLNLQILAAIACLVRKAPSLREKILGAENKEMILNIIREEEEKIDE